MPVSTLFLIPNSMKDGGNLVIRIKCLNRINLPHSILIHPQAELDLKQTNPSITESMPT